MKNKRKLLSLLLALTMLLTMLPVPAAIAVDADAIGITDEFGAPLNNVYVPDHEVPDEHENPVLYASEGEAYQWQLALPGGVWVNIIGDDQRGITLTYAKLASALDESGAVQLRCLVDGEATEAVTAWCYDTEVAFLASDADDDGFPFFTLLSDMEVEVRFYIEPIFSVLLPGVAELDEEPADDDIDVPSTCLVTINYQFEDGTPVSDPYVASLAQGSSFRATVTFPTVLGYLPYVDDVQRDSIELNYDAIDEDYTYTVVYKPTTVGYTVIHYQQHVNDNEYEEVARKTEHGLTNSQVPEVHNTYSGFYNLLYERPAIAADGSTVIEVKYDRYYYLMNFDMDGGYGAEPVYARYGADIGTVNNPTKVGYTFKGWAESKGSEVAVALPTTMPAESKTYYAIWTPDNTAKVTLVFWGENADDTNYSYLQGYTRELYLKPGREFTYNPNDGTVLMCDIAEHAHSATCATSCGKEEHTHSAVGGSCYTLTCGNEVHAHSTFCYDGVGGEVWPRTGVPDNPADGQVKNHWVYDEIIYIGGSWYKYSGSTADGSVAPTTCGKEAHTHNDRCYTLTCSIEAHTHGDACWSCGYSEHTHSDACYMDVGDYVDSAKWVFDRSDTITVAADGTSVVNVYYNRKTFTLHFRKANSNSDTYGTITEKWGASIREKFNEKSTSAGTSLWSVNSSGSDPWTAFLDRMPEEDRTYYANSQSGTTNTAQYFGEPLSGTELELLYTSTAKANNLHVTDEERVPIEGFTYQDSLSFNGKTYTSTANNQSFNGAKFYYTRNTFKIEYNNYVGAAETKAAKYGASIDNDTFNWSPTDDQAPVVYEPGSVTFGGWYLNPQCTGEPYDFTGKTMPVSPNNKDGEVAFSLYAKWIPVTHTVKFYLTESSTDVYTPATAAEPASFTIPHADNIAEEYVKNHLEVAAMNKAKPNGDYTFVMWYYYDEAGVKTAFDPTMQIRKDLVLYGEWSSNTLKEYTVQYVLKDDHSVKVADDLHGSGLAGETKTFDALGGEDLYAAYQEGYFPTVQSKSIVLDIEAESLVLTFEYVPMEAVPYTVYYLTDETVDADTTTYGTIVVKGKTYTKLAVDYTNSDNRKAVVTETFKSISGWMPDAYQKRLVVMANASEGTNVICFFYSRDEVHAYYQVTHYTQIGDTATYTQYGNSSQVVGDIGTRYTASPLTALTGNGWQYVKTVYKVNGEEVDAGLINEPGVALTRDGLEIELYYDHIAYVLDFGLTVNIPNSNGKTFTPGAGFLTAGTTSQNYVSLSGTGYLFYPASNVLYEENFFTNTGWVQTAAAFNSQQADNAALYGYDEAYATTIGANGVYRLDNLTTGSMSTNNTLTTTFYGNGFDLIGTCAPTTGRVFLALFNGSTTRLIDIDTRYSAGTLYQVPLAHVDLEEGRWTATVYAAGLAADAEQDEIAEQLLAAADEVVTLAIEDNSDLYATRGAVTESVIHHEAGTWVEIDAFRVYRSANLAVYTSAEKNATYTNVIDALGSTVITAYVDNGEITVSAGEYESMGGPQNEVYLRKGQAIAFKLGGAQSIDVSIRAVGDASGVYASNTEMYYTIAAVNDVVTIKNDNDNMIAIGNLKLPAGASVEGYSEANAQVLFASVRMAFTSAKPFEPQLFNVQSFVTPLLRKKLVTMAVTVSDDVHHITVNGEAYYPNANLLKWFGRSTITVTLPAVSGDSIEIIACSSSGARSAVKTVNVK